MTTYTAPPRRIMAQRRPAPGASPAVRSMAERRVRPDDFVPPSGPSVLDVIGPQGTIAQKFVGYEARAPQLKLALAIEAAIGSRQHFVGEAGTGVGKSFAYMAPAARSHRKTVVAVPTIALQEQLLGKDAPFLSQPGIINGGFSYALLKGRANYLCLQKYNAFKDEPTFASADDGKSWSAIREWADETPDGDIGTLSIPLPVGIRQEITATSDECLGESCPLYESCHAENARERARNVDIVITNLAMLMMDLQLRDESGGMATILPDEVETLVIDECHQLADAASNAFAKEVKYGRFAFISRRIEALARRAARHDLASRQADELIRAAEEGREPVSVTPETLVEDWSARLAVAGESLREALNHYVLRLEAAETTKQRLGDEWEILFDALTALDTLHVQLLSTPAGLDETDRKSWDKMRDLLETLTADLASVASPERDREVVRFVTLEETKSSLASDGIILTVTPIDVAPILRRVLWDTTFYRPIDKDKEKRDAGDRLPLTVICTSATIATDTGADALRFWLDRVGLADHERLAPGLVVGSPFDYPRHALTYVPSDAAAFDATAARTPQGLSREYLERLSIEYGRLIMASGGRAFCLFTANKTLDYVYRRIAPTLIKRGFLVLRQGEAGQGELVRRFKDDGRAILFGVKSFWEGVDVQGDALSLVIINGMPFTPPDDPVFAAQCEMIDRKYGARASFRMLSIPTATIALKQAYGRGIRSKSDRAVIAILDGRLRTKQYGAGVVKALPPARVTGDLDDVRAFFNS